MITYIVTAKRKDGSIATEHVQAKDIWQAILLAGRRGMFSGDETEIKANEASALASAFWG